MTKKDDKKKTKKTTKKTTLEDVNQGVQDIKTMIAQSLPKPKEPKEPKEKGESTEITKNIRLDNKEFAVFSARLQAYCNDLGVKNHRMGENFMREMLVSSIDYRKDLKTANNKIDSQAKLIRRLVDIINDDSKIEKIKGIKQYLKK